MLGEKGRDALGFRLLRWSRSSNNIAVSSLLPSWAEQEESCGDAFGLTFGLYGREDASLFNTAELRTLAHESARAQLRAVSLAHTVSRRALLAGRHSASLETLQSQSEDKIKDLEKRLEVAENQIQSNAQVSTIMSILLTLDFNYVLMVMLFWLGSRGRGEAARRERDPASRDRGRREAP